MIIFLSHLIDQKTPMYGGEQGFISNPVKSIQKGDTANTSKWEFPNHLGTHIDFPYHFHQNGQTIEDFPDNYWKVDGEKIQIIEVKLPEDKLLIKNDFFTNQKFNYEAEIIIFKTHAGKYRQNERFWKNNPGLSLETTKWLKNNFKKLRFIGFDSISTSSYQHRDIGKQVHRELLSPEKPVMLIEDMDLSKINTDTVFKSLYIAPLRVKKTDGASCTIIAEEKNNG